MRCVQAIGEIRENMNVLDSYLDQKHESEYSFALGLIKRGICFVALQTEHGYRFYPSRFIGYAGNTMDQHLNNPYKDGKKTNPAISKVLGQTPCSDPDLEKAYQTYCESLGFVPNDRGQYGVDRKYWSVE